MSFLPLEGFPLTSGVYVFSLMFYVLMNVCCTPTKFILNMIEWMLQAMVNEVRNL